MRKLVGIDGYAVGQEIPVGNLGLLVGRQSAETPQLHGDHLLSQRHAEILWSGDGGLTIRDAGSTNGTWVNGRRVDSAPLSPGDQIEVGSTLFRLVEMPTPSHQGVAASHVDVQMGGGLSAQGGGIAVARDAGDIHSSNARVAGDYGRAAGRDYFEGDTLEVDLTGFRTARGFARLFLIVGTLVALTGFGLFGYMMLDAFGSFQDVMAQHAECDRNFPLGQQRVECNLNIGLPTIAFVPWGAAGATVMFVGLVVFVIGTMMNRNTDRREERAIRRARSRARR
jgi:FHA domain